MGEIAVHLEHELGAVGECAPEAGEVCGPEAFLACAVQDVDEVELRRQPVGEFARPVRRAVVDHDHADVVLAERVQHRLEILAFVVRRETHRRSRHG